MKKHILLRLLIAALVIAALVGRRRGERAPDWKYVAPFEHAAALAQGRVLGFSDSALSTLAAHGGTLRRLDLHPFPATPLVPGLTLGVEADSVWASVRALRRDLGPGYAVFHSHMNFGRERDRVAVIRASGPHDALWAMWTNGTNFGVYPDSIVVRLNEWERRHGARLMGAGFDWFAAELERPPADMLALAREVYAFCPDVVDQGTSTVQALADEMRQTRKLFCWWD